MKKKKKQFSLLLNKDAKFFFNVNDKHYFIIYAVLLSGNSNSLIHLSFSFNIRNSEDWDSNQSRSRR